MSKVVLNSVVLGQSGTASNNFLLDTDAAGALRIRRNADGSGGTVLTIDSSGIPKDKDGNDLRPLGVGQTWQAVTRTAGTTYTNSTGRPIVFMCSLSVAGAFGFTVAGTLVINANNTSTLGTASIVIPNGATYSYSGSGVSNIVELR